MEKMNKNKTSKELLELNYNYKMLTTLVFERQQ